MASGKGGRKLNSNVNKILKTLLAVILILIISLYFEIPLDKKDKEEIPTITPISTNVEGELKLTMIDVGQADSFLLEQNGKTALIDCGTRYTGKDVVQYLQSKSITKIDYVFGTHPHDDHMGGMYDVITNFEIGTIILPEVEVGEVTTNWYIKLITEVKEENYNLEYAKEGTTYELGNAILKVLGPISKPKNNLNNYSTIIKVTFGEMDIIMTGDAETEVEAEIIAKYGEELDAEILKVGHHGSDTSTSDEFLESVSPEYALISAKIGNKYKHPIKSTMQKLENAGVKVYRSDEQGTVKVIITSTSATFSCESGDYLCGTELKEKEETQ